MEAVWIKSGVATEEEIHLADSLVILILLPQLLTKQVVFRLAELLACNSKDKKLRNN